VTANVFRLVTAGSTNLTKVKDSPAVVKGIIAVNTAAYAIFVKLYSWRPTVAAPTPTVGTTAPAVTIEIPALGVSTGGIEQSWPDGFSVGDANLFMAVTKLAADSDTTAVLAGDGLISLLIE
jgi:hypothetical protein